MKVLRQSSFYAISHIFAVVKQQKNITQQNFGIAKLTGSVLTVWLWI